MGLEDAMRLLVPGFPEYGTGAVLGVVEIEGVQYLSVVLTDATVERIAAKVVEKLAAGGLKSE